MITLPLASCSGRKPAPDAAEIAPPGAVTGSGAVIGGSSAPDPATTGGKLPEVDAMAEHQKKEIERQKKEMDDLRRQKLYDDKYRRFESQHSR